MAAMANGSDKVEARGTLRLSNKNDGSYHANRTLTFDHPHSHASF